MTWVPVFLLWLLAALREFTTCETNIVSATVVATYCSHAAGSDDIVDLMILWRGSPGWFQRRSGGRYGSGGSHMVGGGTGGHVTENRFYGDVEIRYDADFDARTVTIGTLAPIAIDKFNTVLVDGVDRPGGGHVQRTLGVVARVSLGGDHNLKVIQSSSVLVSFLQCEMAMPASRSPMLQTPVITVCDKLASKRE